MDIYNELALPFEASEIEWRIAQTFAKNEAIKAKCLAYVTSRAIMNRLDAVLGNGNWGTEIVPMDKAFLCKLSILTPAGWVTKTDGSDLTDFEAIKGGISGSLKRVAVQVGIGRYLYNLDEGWADIVKGGQYYQAANKSGVPAFTWNPPALPPEFVWPEKLGKHGDLESLLVAYYSGTDKEKLIEGAKKRFWFTNERKILCELGLLEEK